MTSSFYLSAALFFAVGGALAGTANAHDSWIEPKTFQTPPGVLVPVAFYVGHHGEQRSARLAPRPAWLLSMRDHGPRGVTNLLSVGEFQQRSALRYATAGTHVIALATGEFRNDMTPAEFPAYMEEEGLAAAQAAWKRAPVRLGKVREAYRRYAKALVQVGGSPAPGASTQRLGQQLEIVPAANPVMLRGGDRLRATIWFAGRPLAGALVTLGSLDRPKDALVPRRSNAAGKVEFRMPSSGRWMVNVVWGVPSNRPGTDFETSFSSLTFAAPKRR
ncbi:MAG TPA: DUF4198 domain-containing protein [Sphingomicrobium sp.]